MQKISPIFRSNDDVVTDINVTYPWYSLSHKLDLIKTSAKHK